MRGTARASALGRRFGVQTRGRIRGTPDGARVFGMLRPAVPETHLTLFERLWLALSSFFRILANGEYAANVMRLETLPPSSSAVESAAPARVERDLRPALQLLSVLQREGRLVDFVQQDILQFSDADVGAAARVVHDGCFRALQQVAQFLPIRDDIEGHVVTVAAGFDATSLVLTGNVSGAAPFHGTLRHRGWRARGFRLPEIIGDDDCTVIAPAEVEL